MVGLRPLLSQTHHKGLAASFLICCINISCMCLVCVFVVFVALMYRACVLCVCRRAGGSARFQSAEA